MEENKQEYVDTQERIDTFQDESWKKLSVRANNILKAMELDTPAKLKVFVDSDFYLGKRRRLINFGKKTQEELRAFCEYFEQNHPASAYHVLSERETLEYNIRRNASFLHAEDIDFVLSYFDRTNHYPMFYMLVKYFEHSDWRKFQIIRDNLGICEERKTKEQLMEIYHLSQTTIKGEIFSTDHAIWRAANSIERCVANDWEQYKLSDDVLKKPILTNEDFLPLYQSVKEAEQLKMDLECFVEICYHTLGFFGRIEQRGKYWLYTVDGVGNFRFDWLLQDFRKIPRTKKAEPFNLSEACRNTEYWSNEKVVRKAVPTVIEIAKQMIWHLYQLPSKGNKIIIAKS